MKLALVSLGCSKNLVDSEILLGKLRGKGVSITSDLSEADIVVVNTCGFIEDSKRESVEKIIEIANEGKRVLAMGCLVERYRKELEAELHEAEAFFGVSSWDEVLKYLGLEQNGGETERRLVSTPSSYAYLKIAEGCNRLCSFCSIPAIRGKHRSREIKEILEEASYLASLGIKEIDIVSQDTTYYGRDLYGRGYFLKLLEELEKVEGIEWIRLLYLYPTEVNDDLIKLISNSKKILPYFDVPFQHISDRVLGSMRRGYGEKLVRSLIDRIYSELPHAVLRTTFIVGYPEESPKDFDKLLSFVEEGHIHWLGVFTYSHEEGTHAFKLKDSLPEVEKQRRKEEVLSLQKDITVKKNESLLGRELDVLIDGFSEDFPVPIGRTYAHAPEVDGVVYLQSEEPVKSGSLVRAVPERVVDYDLVATAVNNLFLTEYKNFK